MGKMCCLARHGGNQNENEGNHGDTEARRIIQNLPFSVSVCLRGEYSGRDAKISRGA
jgi:hypothetical protein